MGRILLVRHGQASFGADDYDVLSETGWAQGRRLGEWLRERGETPTAVVRGDMRRHRETLEAMTDAAGWAGSEPVVEPVVDADWDEFDHVSLVAAYPDLPAEPLDRRAFQAVFEKATARWTAGEGGADAYAETYAHFVERVRGALVRASAAAGAGETVLVVTSGGAIAAACATLLDPEGDDLGVVARLWSRLNTVTANTSVTRVVVGSTGARLLTFNEHPHLSAELLTYR